MSRPFAGLTAALLTGVLLCGCGSPAATAGAGIEGTVTVGPTCPVVRLDAPCPDRPLQAEVSVRDGSGREVTRFRSGPDGRFRVDLPPGTYQLLGISPGPSGFPRPTPTTATVGAGRYTHVDVAFDSGIR